MDDDAMVLSAVTRGLRMRGFNVTPVTNGVDALEALKGQTFDLVLTDWEMPFMDGDVLCATVKKLYPTVPVILTSGNTGVLTLNCGADAMFMKPYMLADIHGAIQRLIAKSESEVA